MDEDIKSISVRTHGPPEPAFPTLDRDNHFVQMPFVGHGWSVSPDAIGKMAAKAVDPLPDRFPADRHTALREKIFNISGAERKAVVEPDGIGDDLARKTQPLKARHLGRYLNA